MSDKRENIIAVDTGGTFTDALITMPDGSFYAGKDYTDPERLEVSFFGAIADAAKKMNKSIGEVLPHAGQIIYGTTIGTNMIVADVPGPKVGLLTTKGVEDRLHLIRNRGIGLLKREALHMIAAECPRPLISRRLIKGIRERIDSMGKEFIPLDEDGVRNAVKWYIEKEVEAIAVGYLWSFINPSHEVRTREIIKEMAPEVMVALSSDVAPTIREFPRFTSAIIDLYIGKALRGLLERIETRLREQGFTHPLLVMQAIGGVTQSKVVHPCTTLHSGPVGGLAGVEYLKGIYDIKNAVGSDVGGTSFDVTFCTEKGEELLREPVVGRREIATPMREVVTIGAGGGTIAWIHEVTKSLSVGPQSAGAMPGPVCYDTGGTEPTITDADVVTNRIDPNYFLGGARKLNRDKAFAAIKEKIAEPLGLDVMQAAEGVINIVDAAMQATLKSTLARKGFNPAQFTLFAFGGAGPTHCAGYSRGLGFQKVIVTPFSAVFSAFGECATNLRHRYEISPYLGVYDLPFDSVSMRFKLDEITSLDAIPSEVPDKFNTSFETLEKRAYGEVAAEGYRREQVTASYEMLARYGGQAWELRVPVSVSRIKSIEDFKAIVRAFEEAYLQTYGQIAMVPRGGIEIVTVALRVEAELIKPTLVKGKYIGEDPEGAKKGDRQVYFEGKWVETSIYDMDRLAVGNVVKGPAVIETWNTTFIVPPMFVVARDEYYNFVMQEL